MAVDVSLPNILTLISKMSLNEIEQVKNKLVEKELYFKDGSLKKESVVIVPKMTAVDRSIILDKHKIAV